VKSNHPMRPSRPACCRGQARRHSRSRLLSSELSLEVGNGANREGGISWGCLRPPLLHRRRDMPCPTITWSN
jgi:hypothetical protein